jgi:hypothetical protein
MKKDLLKFVILTMASMVNMSAFILSLSKHYTPEAFWFGLASAAFIIATIIQGIILRNYKS